MAKNFDEMVVGMMHAFYAGSGYTRALFDIDVDGDPKWKAALDLFVPPLKMKRPKSKYDVPAEDLLGANMPQFFLEYEKASRISERIAAVEKLQDLGFDVAVRLSPFIPEFIDFDKLNSINCDKIVVEFLRCNSFIRKTFPIDYSGYTVKSGNYRHLPLEKKKEFLSMITGFKEATVCEDEPEAYEYWRRYVNPDPEDCCNLRKEMIACQKAQ